MSAQAHAAEELNLFPQWQSREAAVRARWSRLASVGLHVAVVLVLGFTRLGRTPMHDMSRIVAQLREPVRLIAPPPELTQTAPNRGRVGKEFNLESLLPRPRVFIPPSLPPGAPPAGRPVLWPEPPKIETEAEGVPPLPLPEIQPVEKPKLPLESPAGARIAEAAKPMPSPPSSSIAEMGRGLARGRGVPALVVSDWGEGPADLGLGVDLRPLAGARGSGLELVSDPRGVDFKPYIIQVLAAVRRNWLAAFPLSAKLGQRGKVVIQFTISRDGLVPSVKIDSESGVRALDLAAVAGISASIPFPPLPAEFRGAEVRLRASFLYNMRAY
jgi:TonB family protein